METIPNPAHRGRIGKRCPPIGGRIGNRVKIPDGHAAVKSTCCHVKVRRPASFHKEYIWLRAMAKCKTISGTCFRRLFCVPAYQQIKAGIFLRNRILLCNVPITQKSVLRTCTKRQDVASGRAWSENVSRHILYSRKNRNRNRKEK